MYKIHQSKANHWHWGLWDHTVIVWVSQSSIIHITTNWPPKKTVKSGQRCFGKCHFQSFLPQRAVCVSAKYNRRYENIQTLGWWWVSTQIQSWYEANTSFSLGFLCQKCHKNIKLEKNKDKKTERHLPSPNALYKLKLGWSQTTPLLLHNLLNSDGKWSQCI